MRLDLRSIRALALVAWASVFAWLWITGESVRYLGPRTQWVVPVGAIWLHRRRAAVAMRLNRK